MITYDPTPDLLAENWRQAKEIASLRTAAKEVVSAADGLYLGLTLSEAISRLAAVLEGEQS